MRKHGLDRRLAAAHRVGSPIDEPAWKMSYRGVPVHRAVAERIDDLLVRLGSDQPEVDSTVEDYMSLWLEGRRGALSAGTHASYINTYEYYIRPHLGQIPVRDVTVTMVTQWLSELVAHGGRTGGSLSAATVRFARVVLHKALEDAVTSGELLLNPVSRTRGPARDLEGRRVRYPPATWSIAELRTFLHRIDVHPRGPLFTLMAMTGMRRGEALGLVWDDIDFERNEVTISSNLTEVGGLPRRGPTKSGNSRRIALGERAAEVLELQLDRQRRQALVARPDWNNELDLVFTRPNGDFVRPMTASSAFKCLVAPLPVRRIRLHDLRHTHAVLLLHAGTPVIDVSHRLGHADPGVTLELYAHALHNPGHAVAEVFDRLVDGRRWGTADPDAASG